MNRLKATLLIIITTSILTTLTSLLYANSVSQGIKEYVLNPNDSKIGTVQYRNSSEKSSTIIVSTQSYNPEAETFLDTQPFIAVSKGEYTIDPKGTIDIDYVISVPEKQPAGTYFNVITIEPKEEEKKKSGGINIGVKNGFGVLVAIHVETSEASIDKIFIDQSDTQLIVEKRGIPFLYPLQIKYVYKNNSNFVFKPQGEIRILDSNASQVVERIAINPEAKSVYPGKTFEVTEKVYIWNDINKLFQSRTVTSRTYNGFTQNFLTNKVEVSLKEPIIVTSVIAGILLLTIIWITAMRVKKIVEKSKRQQEPVV